MPTAQRRAYVICGLVAGALGCACATGASADGPDNTAVCSDRAHQIGALIDKADTWCLKDSDCALFMPPTSCLWGCGVVIRADAVDALTAQLQRADKEICFADDILCLPPDPLPPCEFLRAGCYNGGCTTH